MELIGLVIFVGVVGYLLFGAKKKEETVVEAPYKVEPAKTESIVVEAPVVTEEVAPVAKPKRVAKPKAPKAEKPATAKTTTAKKPRAKKTTV